MGSKHVVVLSLGVAALIGFAARAMFARFQSARVTAPHELPFSFNPGNATGTQGMQRKPCCPVSAHHTLHESFNLDDGTQGI